MITKLITPILIIFIIIFCATNLSAETQLESKISQILAQSVLDPNKTAVAVSIADTGKELLSINGDTPLNPASCAKIVTAATALSLLGKDYRIVTDFFADQSINNSGQIKNLYIKGHGDPSFVSEELLNIVYELKKLGLKSITQNIIIDDSFFDGSWYPRKDGDEDRAFTAKTSAFSLNFNAIKFVISPANKVGQKAIVTTDPFTPYVEIINNVVTSPKKFNLDITRRNNSENSEIFIVSGKIPVGASAQSFYRNTRNPIMYAGTILKTMLLENGITVVGDVQRALIPQGAVEILRYKSKPLSDIITDMNKFSNNFIAEQLTKHLGGVKKGIPASTQNGIIVLETFLNSTGIKDKDYTLENGSGLSSTNRISAKNIVTILSAMYKNSLLRDDFINSLSILGVDGTMKKWRHAPKLQGVLRAKTGSLDNVVALSGYVPMKNGKMAAFAILANGFKKGKYGAHEAETMIVSAISELRQ